MQHLIYKIRQQLSSNTILYRAYFYSIRKFVGSKVRLPGKGDDFYFDGYPRSGNTYTYALLKNFIGKIHTAHHLHKIGAVKLALQLNIKTLIIFRKPEDAVLSFAFTKFKSEILNKTKLHYLLLEYMDYYEFVLSKSRELSLINFKDVVDNELSFVQKVRKWMGLEKIDYTLYEEQALIVFREKMKNQEAKKQLHYGSLPNEKRRIYKESGLTMLRENPNYERSVSIYKQLQSQAL